MSIIRIALAVAWVVISLRFIHKDLADIKLVMDHQEQKEGYSKAYWLTFALMWSYMLTNALLPSSIAGFLPGFWEIAFIFVWIACHLWHIVFEFINFKLIDKLSNEREGM